MNSDERKKLEHEFDQEMHRVYENAKKECGYNATYFLQMLRRLGGMETAKWLLRSRHTSRGFGKLHEYDRLDLSVEAVVCENSKWHSLFTEEDIKTARARLLSLDYDPKPTTGRTPGEVEK